MRQADGEEVHRGLRDIARPFKLPVSCLLQSKAPESARQVN